MDWHFRRDSPGKETLGKRFLYLQNAVVSEKADFRDREDRLAGSR
jgi:hypothetical protein